MALLRVLDECPAELFDLDGVDRDLFAEGQSRPVGGDHVAMRPRWKTPDRRAEIGVRSLVDLVRPQARGDDSPILRARGEREQGEEALAGFREGDRFTVQDELEPAQEV
jgi:hypothetical protein